MSDKRAPESVWLNWARKLDAMARIGAEFAQNPYDQRRYAELATIARGMFAELSGRPEVELPELYHHTEGYVTPKVDVRAAVFDAQDRLLLVREVADGRWSLPGGWADVGDTWSGCSTRTTRRPRSARTRSCFPAR
jgi:hypothetical protein